MSKWTAIRSNNDLPLEDGFYLGTSASSSIDPIDATVHELNWFKGKWYLPNDEMIEMDDIVAWMPMPEPFIETAQELALVG